MTRKANTRPTPALPAGEGEMPGAREGEMPGAAGAVHGLHTANMRIYARLKGYAKEMRTNPTPAERVLWRALRGEKCGANEYREVAGTTRDLFPPNVDSNCAATARRLCLRAVRSIQGNVILIAQANDHARSMLPLHLPFLHSVGPCSEPSSFSNHYTRGGGRRRRYRVGALRPC